MIDMLFPPASPSRVPIAAITGTNGKTTTSRMLAHIARREKETGRRAPIYTNLGWHGCGNKPFKSSQQAYDTLHIGSPQAAQKLQAQLKELQTQRGAAKL